MRTIFLISLCILTTACQPPESAKTTTVYERTQNPSTASGIRSSLSASAIGENITEHGEEMIEARQQQIDEEFEAFKKKRAEDQAKLPDNQRDRTGYIGTEDVLVEKSTNTRMRMDATASTWQGKPTIVRELKVIEGGNTYGFAEGFVDGCKESKFEIKKSTPEWIQIFDNCLNDNREDLQYKWLLYDRKHHTLVQLYLINGGNEFQEMRDNDPVASYKNGIYSVYYPHLKDTIYFKVKGLLKPGQPCQWKSGEDGEDNSEKGSICPNTNTVEPLTGKPAQKNDVTKKMTTT